MNADQLALRVKAEEVAALATLGVTKILSAEGTPKALGDLVDDLASLDQAITAFMVTRATGRPPAFVADAAAHVGTCLSLVIRAGFVTAIETPTQR